MTLESLGWSEAFSDYNFEAGNVARIVAVHRSHLRAITVLGEINIHYTDGSSKGLAVGDWVATTSAFTDEQGEPAALVKELIPRKSKISRVAVGKHTEEQIIAANVDNMFIVTSINQDFNINRLQRFLLLNTEGTAKPVVILSKTDLNPSYLQIVKELAEKLDENVLVTAVSVFDKSGINKITDLMPKGSTSVFVGSSGVGKSSLVNYILGRDVQVVKEIRADDGKGRHATTSRQMFFVPGGGMIIDTPGIREVSVFGSEENISETFSEVEELMTQCKFSDCGHNSEPGCAVTQALKSQQLEKKQWDNYLKLSKEVDFNNKKIGKTLSSNSKKRWKKIQTDYKARKRHEGKK